jgi:hypothetical protein
MSKLNFSMDSKKCNTSRTRCKSKEKLLNALRPIVNDFTKPCKKEMKQKLLEETANEAPFKLKFEEVKEYNFDDYLKEQVNEDIRCLICSKLYEDPLSCYKCGRHFCAPCIKSELVKSSRCPSCFCLIFFEMMQNADSNHIENYNLTNIKCPHKGCKEEVNLKDIKSHIDSCIYKESTHHQQQNINKILFNDNATDPYMKVHMLNYLKISNKSINLTTEIINTRESSLNNQRKSSTSPQRKSRGNSPLKTNLRKVNTLPINETVTTISLPSEFDFVPRLSELKGHLGYVNDFLSKTIFDLAKHTKVTNEKLKKIINS